MGDFTMEGRKVLQGSILELGFLKMINDLDLE